MKNTIQQKIAEVLQTKKLGNKTLQLIDVPRNQSTKKKLIRETESLVVRNFLQKQKSTFFPIKNDQMTQDKVLDLQLTALALEPKREELHKKLAKNPTPVFRYQLEYKNHLYQSFKPGIDDARLDSIVNMDIARSLVIEIGGGPAYIAARAKRGVSIDLVNHPALKGSDIDFLPGDICTTQAVQIIEKYHKRIQRQTFDSTLVVLSYCLDRVSCQYYAISNFAAMVKSFGGAGLITVCLPAKPQSSGVKEVSYNTEDRGWFTKGVSAIKDYQSIVKACLDAGLTVKGGGLSTHYGMSLDGYEELPCYFIVVE